jgi:hypothetical protein
LLRQLFAVLHLGVIQEAELYFEYLPEELKAIISTDSWMTTALLFVAEGGMPNPKYR